MRSEEVLEAEERKLQAEVSRILRRIGFRRGGCFTVKVISGRPYAYVARRVLGKLRFTYVGPANTPAAARIRREVMMVRALKSGLRQARTRLRRIQRALARLRPAERIEVNRKAIACLPPPGRRDLGEIGTAVTGTMTMMKGRATFQWSD